MDRDRWSRLSSLFAAALEGDPGQRAALLQGLEDDLRRELQSLLAAHEADGPVDRLGARMDDLRGEAMASVESLPASGPAAAARPMLEPGRRLGRHEIRSQLGAGGMGEVYRAFDTRLQREVAIKILGRRGRQRSGALPRFEQEARAASALNHPNIVSVYDIGEEASHPYIVMELVDGESLRALMSAGPCPDELLLHLAVQMADGLVAAHEREIVHGDLKPENVLVTPSGIAKILDFGLARFRRQEEEKHRRRRTRGAAPGNARLPALRKWSRGRRATGARTSSPWAPCSTRWRPVPRPSPAARGWRRWPPRCGATFVPWRRRVPIFRPPSWKR